MPSIHPRRRGMATCCLAGSLLIAAIPLPTHAQQSNEQALRQRIQALEQRLSELESRQVRVAPEAHPNSLPVCDR